ncbi:hypothetical protein [Streptomyces clavuligerus]|uniref:Putative alanine-rich protein n=1 Tax=Streptomyces clavuligerus TaxID=1901 RepID=E2PYE7_STRCL|nr:hypothetical protein [Streptomyces clavuligerus]ANW20793.1 hypothetical protein BB341_22565 [Streptomyces clavuligerus]AXU15419.1 hypothetical protein D1794_23465 [Streptomyces clavuligerus]EFG06169.1 Putative alanine-rich protein [Streptomyces clavuligerus]MBY6305513.1 hypothetical protein [Streptomyces clavuligerus]QCS08195.1 hypothetical protein CRV15_22830 [Streptomyces clavuligerus]
MRASVFLYPWDVNGDPGAASRIAALGVQQVTLAAAYHSTRALTPRHPRHRIVTAEYASVLYEPDPERWAGRRLRPYPAGEWAPGDAFGTAARTLAAAGLSVHSWVVLAHNSRLGAEHPDSSVVNAYGDRYPWAPCIARPEVRAHLACLAAEAATRPGAHGTELESCGWYGLAHLHAHDKTAGVGLGDAAQYLMSLCFCGSCRQGYAEQGLDPARLAGAVREALRPVWEGSWSAAPADAGIERLLGDEPAAATLDFRARTARTFQEDMVAAVRAAAPEDFQVLLHADPAVHHCGANAGVDPAHILSVADGVVVPCTGGAQALKPFAGHAADHSVLAANLTVVSGMGGSPGTLEADARRAVGLGATELRLYHAGLASDQDLRAVRAALSRLP